MATYLDRVAAAGTRVNLEARPSPADPPVLPGMVTRDHLPVEEGSAFHPAMENRAATSIIPAASDTVLPESAGSANTVAIRSTESAPPRVTSETNTAPAVSVPSAKSKPLPARVAGSSSESSFDPSPKPPVETLPLNSGARPSLVASAVRASQTHGRAPRVTTRVNNNPVSSGANDLSLLSALSVPAPSPAIPPSREHSTDGPENRDREIADVIPRSLRAEDSESQSASAAVPQPTIGISPMPVAHASTSRSSEAEPRITIGRVDVLVNNQLPPRPFATVASSGTTSAHMGLRAHFLDRFILRP
jgi:hypothetical protein